MESGSQRRLLCELYRRILWSNSSRFRRLCGPARCSASRHTDSLCEFYSASYNSTLARNRRCESHFCVCFETPQNRIDFRIPTTNSTRVSCHGSFSPQKPSKSPRATLLSQAVRIASCSDVFLNLGLTCRRNNYRWIGAVPTSFVPDEDEMQNVMKISRLCGAVG